jgi:hypothetical protein
MGGELAVLLGDEVLGGIHGDLDDVVGIGRVEIEIETRETQ